MDGNFSRRGRHDQGHLHVRISCSVEGLESAWVDVTEVGWTTRQLDELRTMNGADTLDMLQRKLTACELPTVDGEPVTDPAQITAHLDSFDLRLLGFLGGVLFDAAPLIRGLGFFTGRRSMPSSG